MFYFILFYLIIFFPFLPCLFGHIHDYSIRIPSWHVLKENPGYTVDLGFGILSMWVVSSVSHTPTAAAGAGKVKELLAGLNKTRPSFDLL